jgi:hypothetical protein
MTKRDVVQFGTISNIHIRAAKMNRAMTRCWTGVRSGIPKKDVGTAQRKIVIINTIGRRTQYFVFIFLVAIKLKSLSLALKARKCSHYL